MNDTVVSVLPGSRTIILHQGMGTVKMIKLIQKIESKGLFKLPILRLSKESTFLGGKLYKFANSWKVKPEDNICFTKAEIDPDTNGFVSVEL